ncbi:MAG: peptidase domain-containing ABC transporter, partial [Ruminococcus flavefaciens]|nr:peptidase domain-containing ABC transporter [Ruminococcus flavefaciens]
IVLFKPLIEKINMKIMTANAMTTANFKESIDGIETIRLYNAENYSLDKLDKNIKELTKNIFKGQVTYSVQDSFVYLIESLSLILTLWIGSKLVMAGQLTLGFLMTFSTLIGYIIMPIKEIIEMQPSIQKAFVAADRLNDVLDSQNELSGEIADDTVINGNIELKDVFFRYNNDFLVLKGLTMSIKRGEKIAITGESGCGKTTIAKLLMKIYSPESGYIRIGNSDIEEIPYKMLRQRAVYIPQDTFLFSDTIRNNLTLGDEDITDGEIDRVCKISMIYDFIEHLPYGLDTMLDEGGKNLSGGQRQRLAIARALLRKPNILIMDEATGQLDGKTELAVHNAILKECCDMTCIIIAHRLTTLKRCDKIAVIDDGKVCEYGTHEELMNLNGKYCGVWSDYNGICGDT